MSFLAYMKKGARPEHLEQLIISALLGYCLGGFVTGMVWCECGFNIFERVFAGILVGLFSVISLGFPPADEAGVNILNAWPYIFVCWVVTYLALCFHGYKQSANVRHGTLSSPVTIEDTEQEEGV
jgi:hypothetical protein